MTSCIPLFNASFFKRHQLGECPTLEDEKYTPHVFSWDIDTVNNHLHHKEQYSAVGPCMLNGHQLGKFPTSRIDKYPHV